MATLAAVTLHARTLRLMRCRIAMAVPTRSPPDEPAPERGRHGLVRYSGLDLTNP